MVNGAAAPAVESATRNGRRPLQLVLLVNPIASGLHGAELAAARRILHGAAGVEAVWTDHRGDAERLGREAAEAGVDLVAVVGGDGTVNEVAGGLAGTATAMACLPAGVTNVFARSIGVPRRLIPAAEQLAALVREGGGVRTRRVDLGTVNGRPFVSMSGVGFTASMSATADAAPSRKARLGQLHFAGVAASEIASRYLRRPPVMRVRAGGREADGITMIVQNSHALTYFGRREISAIAGAGLDTGSISAAVLRRARPTDLPSVVTRLVGGAVTDHPQVEAFEQVRTASVTSVDGEPLPLEADGEFLGECLHVEYGVLPGALRVVDLRS